MPESSTGQLWRQLRPKHFTSESGSRYSGQAQIKLRAAQQGTIVSDLIRICRADAQQIEWPVEAKHSP